MQPQRAKPAPPRSEPRLTEPPLTAPPQPRSLYHLALAGDWEAALARGEYTVSSLGRSLEDEGFIHMSRARQVEATAERFYSGRDDVVLLTVDPDRLGAAVVDDPVGEDHYPHLYGPLDPAAVTAVTPLPLGGSGHLLIPADVGRPHL